MRRRGIRWDGNSDLRVSREERTCRCFVFSRLNRNRTAPLVVNAARVCGSRSFNGQQGGHNNEDKSGRHNPPLSVLLQDAYEVKSSPLLIP
jgi:hypothetical protein